MSNFREQRYQQADDLTKTGEGLSKTKVFIAQKIRELPEIANNETIWQGSNSAASPISRRRDVSDRFAPYRKTCRGNGADDNDNGFDGTECRDKLNKTIKKYVQKSSRPFSKWITLEESRTITYFMSYI